MLDRDLAALYGVETKNLNKAVQRNTDRFPADFMFQLAADEAESLRFQFGTLKRGQHLSICTLFDAIDQLTTPPSQSPREIGFHVKDAPKPYHVKRK
jgi:hypothetical protein